MSRHRPAAESGAQSLGPDELLGILRGLLEEFEAAEGAGPDEHARSPAVQPMAEGKYLQALACLRRSGLVSGDVHAKSLGRSLARLQSTRAAVQGSGLAWGLGFPFAGAPATEPYVITTGIVTAGLLESLPLVEGEDRRGVLALAEPAVHWLVHDCVRTTWRGVQVPVYSPHVDKPVHNVVAYWAGVVRRAADAGLADSVAGVEAVAAAEAVLAAFRPHIGWTYDDRSSRADLLHTCYIGSGLAMVLPDQVDRAMLVATTQFLGPDGWTDRFDVTTAAQQVQDPLPWVGRASRFLGETALVGFDRPARHWSLGELLAFAAAASRRQTAGRLWQRQLRPIAATLARQHDTAPSFRHSMHIAHGFGAALEVLRDRGGESGPGGGDP